MVSPFNASPRLSSNANAALAEHQAPAESWIDEGLSSACGQLADELGLGPIKPGDVTDVSRRDSA